MLLAIDVGNTNTVLGLYNAGQGEQLVHHFRIATNRSATSDEMSEWMLSLVERKEILRRVLRDEAPASYARRAVA